jgi:hypothetical protein
MNNMFGQNNHNNDDPFRIRRNNDTGRGGGDGHARRFDPDREAFRAQYNQGHGGNGTDAPPTYEEAVRGGQFDPGRAAFRAQYNQGHGGNGTDAPPTYEEAVRGDQEPWRQTARRFMRRVAEYGVLSQISAADALMFNNWLYRPDGRLHLDRALLLAHFERQYNNRRAFQDKPSEKELLEFFKFCAKKLNEQQEAEKKEVKKVEADPSDPNSPAFEAGYEAGYESLEKREGYFSDSGYSSDSDVESDF